MPWLQVLGLWELQVQGASWHLQLLHNIWSIFTFSNNCMQLQTDRQNMNPLDLADVFLKSTSSPFSCRNISVDYLNYTFSGNTDHWECPVKKIKHFYEVPFHMTKLTCFKIRKDIAHSWHTEKLSSFFSHVHDRFSNLKSLDVYLAPEHPVEDLDILVLLSTEHCIVVYTVENFSIFQNSFYNIWCCAVVPVLVILTIFRRSQIHSLWLSITGRSSAWFHFLRYMRQMVVMPSSLDFPWIRMGLKRKKMYNISLV